MNVVSELALWLSYLGKPHSELLELGLDPKLRFINLFPGAFELYLEPEPGVNYRFDRDTKILESVIVTLIRRVEDEPEFKGSLPQPYGCRDKNAIRAALGEPLKSRGQMAMPLPIGQTGGWDVYRLGAQGLPNVELVFKYTADFIVCGLVLRAIKDEA